MVTQADQLLTNQVALVSVLVQPSDGGIPRSAADAFRYPHSDLRLGHAWFLEI